MTLCTIARNRSGLPDPKMARRLFIRQFEVDALTTPHQLKRSLAVEIETPFSRSAPERVNDFETRGCIYLVSKDRVLCWRRPPVRVGNDFVTCPRQRRWR